MEQAAQCEVIYDLKVICTLRGDLLLKVFCTSKSATQSRLDFDLLLHVTYNSSVQRQNSIGRQLTWLLTVQLMT